MRQLPSDKHTIAWFKLAEFVSRGEKERALGIYKLLILSINDLAFANKLEGDILFSFNDQLAIEKYQKAAILYQKEERLIEAAAVYENLLSINPENTEYLKKLIELYSRLNLKEKINFSTIRLALIYLKKNVINEVIKLLNEFEFNSHDSNADLLEQISFELINKKIDENLISKYINFTLETYFINNDRIKLQHFLSKLESKNNTYYLEAIKQIKD